MRFGSKLPGASAAEMPRIRTSRSPVAAEKPHFADSHPAVSCRANIRNPGHCRGHCDATPKLRWISGELTQIEQRPRFPRPAPRQPPRALPPPAHRPVGIPVSCPKKPARSFCYIAVTGFCRHLRSINNKKTRESSPKLVYKVATLFCESTNGFRPVMPSATLSQEPVSFNSKLSASS